MARKKVVEKQAESKTEEISDDIQVYTLSTGKPVRYLRATCSKCNKKIDQAIGYDFVAYTHCKCGHDNPAMVDTRKELNPGARYAA